MLAKQLKLAEPTKL